MDVPGFAEWGFMGAVIYAAPRGLVRLSEASLTKRRGALIVAELVIALLIGTIGAAAFSQIVASTLHQTAEAELRAIAAVMGMVANPVAPAIVHLVSEGFLRRFGAPINRRGLPK